MKNEWEQELVNKQFGVQDLTLERKSVYENTNFTHAMANLEVAELKKARHNTHQFTYLYTRQPIEYKPPSSPLETEEDLGKDIILQIVSIDYNRFGIIKFY